MAFNSKDASGATVAVTTVTNTGGDHKQVYVLGRPDSDSPATFVNGGLNVTPQARTSSTSARTQVTAATADTQLLAANANRKQYKVWNNSATAYLYLGEGTGAVTAANATLRLGPNEVYESPANPVWTGMVRAIWDTASGTANVTELT